MSEKLTVGMIGLDTSHVLAFTRLLNNEDDPHYIPGAKVVAAFPGGSPDFDKSISRVEGFTNDLRDQFGVEMLDSPEAVAEKVDLLFISSVDGRVHRELFEKTVKFGKPTFIDKPFTISTADAQAIVDLAKQNNVPVMSTSSLRYADAFAEAISDTSKGKIVGIDAVGPMALEPVLPGLFWYGVHTAEMVYAAMGPGCKQVTAHVNEGVDIIVGEWKDGRMATIRGLRQGHPKFGATVHFEEDYTQVSNFYDGRPYYASLLEAIMRSLSNGKSDIPAEEMVEVIRFMEAANEARETGKTVQI